MAATRFCGWGLFLLVTGCGYLHVLSPKIELCFAPVEVLLHQMDYVVVVFLSAPGRVGNRGDERDEGNVEGLSAEDMRFSFQ